MFSGVEKLQHITKEEISHFSTEILESLEIIGREIEVASP